MVGVAGFEPTATRPPDACATRMRYTTTLTRQIILPDRAGTWQQVSSNLINQHHKLMQINF